MFAIAAVSLLSMYGASRADAGPISEGPLHWTARHVRNVAVDTGDTLRNVARTAGRTIHHRTEQVREAFE